MRELIQTEQELLDFIDLPEVQLFMDTFEATFRMTLDELGGVQG